jgi:hypothetical protein
MARYVLVLISSEGIEDDFGPMYVQSDDIRETIRALVAEQGADIILDMLPGYNDAGCQVPTEASLDEITRALETEGKWGGQDGSYCVACVDTEKTYDTTL